MQMVFYSTKMVHSTNFICEQKGSLNYAELLIVLL